jgi:cytosine deaminase
VIVGENRSFMGEEAWLKSRGVAIEVVDDAECVAMMHDFMRDKPELWNEDIGV